MQQFQLLQPLKSTTVEKAPRSVLMNAPLHSVLTLHGLVFWQQGRATESNFFEKLLEASTRSDRANL